MLGRRWGTQEPPACPMVLPHLRLLCWGLSIGPILQGSCFPLPQLAGPVTFSCPSLGHTEEKSTFALLSPQSRLPGAMNPNGILLGGSGETSGNQLRRTPSRGARAQGLRRGHPAFFWPQDAPAGVRPVDASSSMTLQRQGM